MRAKDRFSQLSVWMTGLLALVLASSMSRAQYPAADPPPTRVTVSDVLVQGNLIIPTQQIKSLLKTRPGLEYDPEQVREDVRRLMATKQLGNVEAVPQFSGETVKVYFLVREYPNVIQKVTYQGAKHLKEKDLNELTSIRTGTPLNPIHNKLACQSIVRKLNEDGRPFAHCELLKGDRPGDTEVIFNITEGPIIAVAGIDFLGNTFVPGGVLRNHITSSKKFLGAFGGKYNSLMADADSQRLEEYYRSHGFLDVRVSRELQYLPGGRDVNLIFHIREGQRYQVKDTPQIHGLKQVPVEQVAHLATVKPGDFYSQAEIDKDLSRIKDFVGYTGREVRASATPVFHRESPGVVTVHYEVEDQAPARVGYVYIVGNTRTRQDKILNQIPLFPGQLLTYPDLRVAEEKLRRLNIFKVSPDGAVRPSITVLDNPSNPDSEYKDLLVTVEEDNTGSLLFGLGVNSDAGLTGSIVLNERNFDITRVPTSFDDLLSGNAFRGAGQEFRMEAVPGTQLQRYTVSWRDPFFLNSNYDLGLGGYYYTRGYNEYLETRLGGRVTVGRRLNDIWRVSGGVRAEDVSIFEIPFGAPPEITDAAGGNFLLGLRGSVIRDTRDSLLRPTEGSLIDLSYEQVLGDYQFPSVSAEANQYFTTYERADGSGRHVLALRSQVSWAGQDAPVFERFFAGGIRTIRGFDFRGVGPDVNGFKVGGTFMWLNSIEYQVPILANDRMYMVGFVDSGTVEQDVSIRDYRVSAGFGFRFVVPMLGPMPIALDFGFPVVKASFDQERIFNFFVGFTR